MASSRGILYAEELKATMRARFAWLGAAVILLEVGGLATVGTRDTWLDGYQISVIANGKLVYDKRHADHTSRVGLFRTSRSHGVANDAAEHAAREHV
jgi:hypothetical protein